jgi:ectoine hydroxylase-related dioxygenase (phytanoyl-CoA dioxygenase family)
MSSGASRLLNLPVFRESVKDAGFALVPQVFPSEQLMVLESVLSDPMLRRSRAGLRHAMKINAIAAFAEKELLLTLVRSILGEDAFPFRATMFQKSPEANWLVVWHQDTALPLRRRCDTPEWGPWSVKDGVNYAHAPANVLERMLALRVHLDESSQDNGPLRVLPGTHTRGVLTDDAVHELAQQVPPVDCNVDKGGIVAMRPLLIHSSSKVRSTRQRRVLHLEYANRGAVGNGLQLAIA